MFEFMIFVVSTGRSGTKSLASYLTLSNKIKCVHEPEPVLIKESTQYLYNEIIHEHMVQILKVTRPETIMNREYAESNNKLSFVLPAINEAFPEAKIVWLIRDGREVVSSFYSLGFYDPAFKEMNLWHQWMISGEKLNYNSTEWNKLSSFGKCCWYWYFTNRLIENNLKQFFSGKSLLLVLEELDNNIGNLEEFLSVDLPDKLPWLNIKRNRISKYTWPNWSFEDKALFERICGNLMDIHYPKWRDGNGNWQYLSKGRRNLLLKNNCKKIFQEKVETNEYLKYMGKCLGKVFGKNNVMRFYNFISGKDSF